MTRPAETPCPHAETTTLLWLYGEGPEDHVHHVTGCAECTAVVEQHSELMVAVGPSLGALAEAEAVPSVEAEPSPVPAAANRAPWMLAAVLGVALAAAVLLAFVPRLVGSGEQPLDTAIAEAPETPVTPEGPDAPPPDAVTPEAPDLSTLPEVFVQQDVDTAEPEPAPIPDAPEPVPTPGADLDQRLAELDLDLGTPSDPLDLDLGGLADELDLLEASLATTL